MADDSRTAQDTFSPLTAARKSDDMLVPGHLLEKRRGREAGTEACHIQRGRLDNQVWKGDTN
jgi:hypothetical protein